MNRIVSILSSALFAFSAVKSPAQDDYKPGPDSIAQPNVPRGDLIKGTYTAKEGSVFPGTGRDYTIYLPAGKGDAPVPATVNGGKSAPITSSGFDKTKPAPFMVFQDGVIYNAPVVFDNLIAKKEIPPLVGIFIKPGVVPAANENALPRFNRSYEYDSVSDTYARFLIDEFLPAIEAKHGIKLSTDPNDAAIAGNSSGGICAFMAAWHRPDRFRRVFSGVGTYVGIHGADQLPVLLRKIEPKPLRVYLQSGEHDNNLYCGDWWMANQTMERALTWAGYDVNHTWGTGGHNAKHATAIFPDVMRWLWKGWPEGKEIKANPRGESKWRGYEVVGDGEWQPVVDGGPAWPAKKHERYLALLANHDTLEQVSTTPAKMSATASGDLFAWLEFYGLCRIRNGEVIHIPSPFEKGAITAVHSILSIRDGTVVVSGTVNENGSEWPQVRLIIKPDGKIDTVKTPFQNNDESIRSPAVELVSRFDGLTLGIKGDFIVKVDPLTALPLTTRAEDAWELHHQAGGGSVSSSGHRTLVFSPDQTLLYECDAYRPFIFVRHVLDNGEPGVQDAFYQLEEGIWQLNNMWSGRMCVDTNGWLYVATALGIQVCDQAGRVNFIIPTPQQPHDVCFGGKDLSSIFIACGDKIYKRPTKARGIVSGQMPPIKPAPPKL